MFHTLLALCLICLPCICPASHNQLDLSVLSLNVWGLQSHALLVKERMKAIGQFLQRGVYDVVVLQELWMLDDYDIISSFTKDKYHITKFYDLSGVACTGVWVPIGCSGLVILAKYPFSSVSFLPFSVTGAVTALDGEMLVSKGIGQVRINPVPHLSIDILNTHTAANSFNKYYREIQVNETVQAIQISDADVIILGGDINYDMRAQTESSYGLIRGTMEDSFLLANQFRMEEVNLDLDKGNVVVHADHEDGQENKHRHLGPGDFMDEDHRHKSHSGHDRNHLGLESKGFRNKEDDLGEDLSNHVEDLSNHVEDRSNHVEDLSNHEEDRSNHVEDLSNPREDLTNHVEDLTYHVEDLSSFVEDLSSHVEDPIDTQTCDKSEKSCSLATQPSETTRGEKNPGRGEKNNSARGEKNSARGMHGRVTSSSPTNTFRDSPKSEILDYLFHSSSGEGVRVEVRSFKVLRLKSKILSEYDTEDCNYMFGLDAECTQCAEFTLDWRQHAQILCQSTADAYISLSDHDGVTVKYRIHYSN